MLVRALRECFVGNGFRVPGSEFDYSGPPNRHLEPVSGQWPEAGSGPPPAPAPPVAMAFGLPMEPAGARQRAPMEWKPPAEPEAILPKPAPPKPVPPKKGRAKALPVDDFLS